MRNLSIASTFGLASLFSFGGASTVVPQLQLSLVDHHHWLTERQFADGFGISQITPGPNTLLATLLGLQMSGLPGAAIAFLAISLPSCIVAVLAMKVWLRTGHAGWHARLEWGLAPLGVGLLAASGGIVAQIVDHDVWGWAVTAGAALVLFATTVNPLWIIAAGALAGICAGGV